MPTLNPRPLSEALDELRAEVEAEIANGATPVEYTDEDTRRAFAFRKACGGQLVGEKYGNMHLVRDHYSGTPKE